MREKHALLRQHLDNGDQLASIGYMDRYLFSPWTVMLLAELIRGLKHVLHKTWVNPSIRITSAPKAKQDGYQKRGLFADWQDDDRRLAVMQGYFAAMNENCTAVISADTPHGRFMQLDWHSGKVTTLRFDQGVGYWGCDSRMADFDNFASALEQAENMMSLVNHMKVKNHKNFPTQVFIKER